MTHFLGCSGRSTGHIEPVSCEPLLCGLAGYGAPATRIIALSRWPRSRLLYARFSGSPGHQRVYARLRRAMPGDEPVVISRQLYPPAAASARPNMRLSRIGVMSRRE
jgi:hypothetical protein